MLRVYVCLCVCMCESLSLSRSLSLYVCVNAYTWLCVWGSFAGVVWRGCRAWLRANPEKATLEGETERMRHVGRKRDREGESSTGRIDSGWIPSRSRAPVEEPRRFSYWALPRYPEHLEERLLPASVAIESRSISEHVGR